MDFEWWHWIVLGIALVIAELAVPAFFVIWFGLGALLVGLVLLVAPLGATAQIGLWIVASVAMVGLWFRVYFDLGVREQDHRGMVKANGSAN